MMPMGKLMMALAFWAPHGALVAVGSPADLSINEARTAPVMAGERRGEAGETQYQRLFQHLFGSGRYRKELRPVHNASQTLNVSLQLWFKQVLKMDEVDQVVSVYCWLEEFWRDPQLTWEPKDFDGVTTIAVPAELVWQPDILVYNNANMHIRDNEHSTNVHIRHNGDMMLFRALITDIACSLDMTYFPFDQQTCYVMLASWSYDGSQLALKALKEKASLQFYVQNSEWELLQFRHKVNVQYYDCCAHPYSDISYHFVLRRNPAYYILSLIVPSAFITVVTLVGFFVPHSSSGENTEKVSLGVTALLSLAIILLMVADKMPATSKVIPLIGIYYIGLIFWIFTATVASTVCLSVQLRGQSGEPIPPSLRHFAFDILASTLRIRINLPHYRPGTAHPPTQEMSETTLLLQPTGNHASNNAPPKPPPLAKDASPLDAIRSILEGLRAEMAQKEGLAVIRREWEALARVLERAMMYAFIALLLLFTVLVLSQRGPDIQLTDELMAQVKD